MNGAANQLANILLGNWWVLLLEGLLGIGVGT
jgi:hypothetical protein